MPTENNTEINIRRNCLQKLFIQSVYQTAQNVFARRSVYRNAYFLKQIVENISKVMRK